MQAHGGMKCQELMKNKVECLNSQETVEAAARRMKERDIGFLPICDADGRVLGTLTDRDITIRCVAGGKPATTPVADVMTREVVSCSPDDDLERAQELMRQHKKSRILCIDASDRLVGVISLSDFAQEDGDRAARTLAEVAEREVHP
jgi:CBS domain-containing protein